MLTKHVIRTFLFTLALAATTTFVQNTDVYAETATSGNLLPNGTGCNNNLTTSSVPGVGCSGSGKQLSPTTNNTNTTNQGFDVRDGAGYEFGTSGTKDIEANSDITIGSSGSLENITVTKQTGGTTTTTTDMLDGGVTLKSTTETQNCEWQGSAYQCGQARVGRDTFTVRVQIKDASGNVLATVEQNRNTDAGYYGNTAIHEDTVTHTGEGARSYDWQWRGIDGNNTPASRVGPNLLGAALEMTLADIAYTPTPPISEETQEEIEEAEETIEEVENIIENIPVEEIIEGVEEVTIEEPTVEVAEPTIEEPTVEITEQAFQESFQENFTAVLEEEGLTETFEQALEEEGITEQQFFESVTEMVTEEFSTPTEETAVEEPTVEEEPVVEETPAVEETPTESETVNTSEEAVETESETTETEASTETEPTESETNTSSETSETGNEETTSETQTEESETESSETTETESTDEEESSGDVEESVGEEDGDSTSAEGTEGDASVDGEVDSEVSEITKKVEKVLKKLESKLKTLDQKLKVISIVTLQGMVEEQPDMSEYTGQQFYDTRKIPDNPDWYAEDTILMAYGRSIYQDKTLQAYQTNDPMYIHAEKLNKVNENISRLEAELEVLKNENN